MARIGTYSAGRFTRLSIVAEGLTDLQRYLEVAPEITRQAARIAINDIARGPGLKLLRREIEKQAAFPAGYLDDPSRIGVTALASDNSLEAKITARGRATSLARFAGPSPFPTPRGGGVTVTVNPGQPRLLKNAFLVRLRRGASLTDDSYNLGLAVRLKPGQQIRNKNSQSAIQLSHNLYLLYGPSVDQVFRDVAVEQSDALATMVGDEFRRQFTRLSEDAR